MTSTAELLEFALLELVNAKGVDPHTVTECIEFAIAEIGQDCSLETQSELAVVINSVNAARPYRPL